MSKKFTFVSVALLLGLVCCYFATPVFATDEPESISVVTSETGDGEIAEPTGPSEDNGETVSVPTGDESTEGDNTGEENESTSENATDEEAEEDAELWPMYVSLGALGGAIILVIIINIALGRKKK